MPNKKAKPSKPEAEMLAQIRAAGLAEPVCEHRFLPGRRFRLDFAWPEQRLGVEVHGGVWTHGRHTRGAGFARDREKMNYAVMAGWRVLEFISDDVRTGAALGWIEEFLHGSAQGRYPVQGASPCPASRPPP